MRSNRRSSSNLPLVTMAPLGVLALAMTNYFATAQSRSAQGEPSPPATAVRAAEEPVATEQQPLPDQDYLQNPQAAAQRVERLVRESGGDWNKISPNDQRMLNSMTAGRGQEMLRTKAAEERKKRVAAPRLPARGG